MPEGDAIRRNALALAPLLVDRTLVAVYQRGLPVERLAGARVVSIEARGKHLLIATDRDLVAHVHLGMNGGWRKARAPVETWRLERADLALVTDEHVFVCRARTVELVRAPFVKSHPALAALGPDLLGETVDIDAVVARARRGDPAQPVADLLLDQDVAAGIGNIWKNETLFREKVHPGTPVGKLDDDALRRLYGRARELLQSGVAGGGRLYVYRRAGHACHACGSAIASEMTMPLARATYFCPRCQPSL